MPRKKVAPKVFASESVLNEKKSEIKELESMLRGGQVASGVGFRNDKISDPDLIRAEIARREKFIKSNTPVKLKGEDANKAYKRAKEIAEELKEVMPSKKMFFQRYPTGTDRASRETNFEEAVRQQMAFQNPQVQRKVDEYRHIMSRLDPSNPMVRNIEQLRRSR